MLLPGKTGLMVLGGRSRQRAVGRLPSHRYGPGLLQRGRRGRCHRRVRHSREEIFLVTKVWISNNGEKKAAASIDESLRKLKTDYIDLLLIHQAYGDVFGTWRAMEKAYRDGKVRAIGVSNFQAGRFFDLAHYVDVKPMVNQLQCNVMVQQRGIEPILAEFNTKMMAWGPLGGQGVDGIVKNEKLAAIGSKYGKSSFTNTPGRHRCSG